MKHFLYVTLLLCSATAFAQDWRNDHKKLRGTDRPDSIKYFIPYKNGDIVFERTIDLASKSRDEIYTKALLALPKSLLEVTSITNDRTAGVVLVNGFINVPKTGELHRTPVTLTAECKEGSCILSLFNIEGKEAKSKGGYVWLYEKIVLEDAHIGERKRRKKDLVQLYDHVKRMFDQIQNQL